MTVQRLELERTATFQASPKTVTFTFPPVPQGLTWTGSVGFSVALGLGPDLQGVVWTAFRNGMPLLSWQEFGVASEIQATSAEVITVVGVYVGSAATIPQFEIRCTWTGYSDDSYNVAPAMPWVSGSDRGLVQVYNSGGPDKPLEVTPPAGQFFQVTGQGGFPVNVQGAGGGPVSVKIAPQGTEAQRAVAAANSSVLLLGTPAGGHPYRLWELTLQITAASISTETGAKWLTGTMSEDTTSKALLQGQVSTVPGSADSCTLHIPMHGYTMPDGAALLLATSPYTGANANVTGSVVYEVT